MFQANSWKCRVTEIGKGRSISTLTYNDRGRRATDRADADWRDSCGDEAIPSLASLGIGDTAKEWHDRFLIRGDKYIPYAVFIACGDTIQSTWDMDRLGSSIEDTIPDNLQDRFTEGCQRSLEISGPVPVEGRYRDNENVEVLFRCVMMPVRDLNDDISFIYGAYSHKIAA